jgi:hypothetical protein
VPSYYNREIPLYELLSSIFFTIYIFTIDIEIEKIKYLSSHIYIYTDTNCKSILRIILIDI